MKNRIISHTALKFAMDIVYTFPAFNSKGIILLISMKFISRLVLSDVLYHFILCLKFGKITLTHFIQRTFLEIETHNASKMIKL